MTEETTDTRNKLTDDDMRESLNELREAMRIFALNAHNAFYAESSHGKYLSGTADDEGRYIKFPFAECPDPFCIYVNGLMAKHPDD